MDKTSNLIRKPKKWLILNPFNLILPGEQMLTHRLVKVGINGLEPENKRKGVVKIGSCKIFMFGEYNL